MNITTALEKQGLKPHQIKVYLTILELGRATTIEVAKKTGIKRTTTYDLIEDLIRLGYVAEARKGKRRLFIAEDPSLLAGKLEQKLTDIKSVIPTLLAINSKAVPKPTVRFYDGVEGARKIMEELLTMKDKEQLYWSSVSDLVDFFGHRYMQSWVKRRIKRGIWSRALLSKKSKVPDIYLQSDAQHLREIRHLPQGFLLDGVLCIFDNKVAYISSRQESFGFVIESEEFSKVIKLIFQSMWAITK